eukprot:gene37256-60512_t
MAQGLYPAGAKLPTEAALSARFGVNRHTVRHALADLAARGLVVSRRGAGVFVASRPTDYAIGRRVRFNQNVTAAGQTPSRDLTRLETRPAAAHEAEALGLPPGAPVQVVEGVSLADGQPLAMFCSVFPAMRFPDLLDALRDLRLAREVAHEDPRRFAARRHRSECAVEHASEIVVEPPAARHVARPGEQQARHRDQRFP